MKKLLLSLSLFTAANYLSAAKVKTGNYSVAFHSDFLKNSEIQFKGYLQKQNNLSEIEKKRIAGQNTLIIAPSARNTGDKTPTNKFRVFIGIGNNNIFSDFVTLTDKSFLGELGWQIRGGVRLKNNYELNFAIYGRNCPDIKNYPGYSYNKFSGFSGAFVYEFKNPGSRWGVPFGLELLKYTKNFKYTGAEENDFYDNYSALSYGPKIGLRYHISDQFFLEAECEALYEHFKSDVDWGEKNILEANRVGSLKFFGLSANRSF